jgi:hypothetical protein
MPRVLPTAAARLPANRARALRRARNRRFHQRSRSGVAIALVEYDGQIVDVLRELRYLSNDHPTSEQVAAAITAALKSLCNNR